MKLSKKKAVILISHGSLVKNFGAAMEKVRRSLERDGRFGRVYSAHLEITPPLIPEAIDNAVKNGATEIKVLPYFLLTGKHVTRDIPRIITEARKKQKTGAKILLCDYLGYDEKIVSVVKQRICEA